MSEIGLFIRHRALSGQREEVRRVWEKHLMPNIAANPAHEAYFYCYDEQDPDVIRVYQQYADRAAAQEFMKTPGYASYTDEVAPLLAEEAEVHVVVPAWTKAWPGRAAA